LLLLLLPLLGWLLPLPRQAPLPCAWAPCWDGTRYQCECADKCQPVDRPQRYRSNPVTRQPPCSHMAAQAVRVVRERKASLGWGQRASRASMHAVH